MLQCGPKELYGHFFKSERFTLLPILVKYLQTSVIPLKEGKSLTANLFKDQASIVNLFYQIFFSLEDAADTDLLRVSNEASRFSHTPATDCCRMHFSGRSTWTFRGESDRQDSAQRLEAAPLSLQLAELSATGPSSILEGSPTRDARNGHRPTRILLVYGRYTEAGRTSSQVLLP